MKTSTGASGGAGSRPWLLIPKYFCVAMLLGGLVTTLVLLPGMPAAGGEHPAWQLLKRIYHWQIIPGAIGSVFFGVLLLLQHPRELLRRRWMVVKLIAVVLLVPSAHVELSRELDSGYVAWEFVFDKTAVCLALFLLIAILGRLKPRLGQKYASLL